MDTAQARKHIPRDKEEGQVRELAALQRLLETDDGQTVMEYLSKKFHVFNSTCSGKEQPHMTYYFEGQRSVILHMLRMGRVNLARLDAILERNMI